MLSATILAFLSASLAIAAPIYPRDVTLDPTAVTQAQQRDDTATRAFSAAQIQTADGQCLAVDPASGDFRENLIPIQVVACNGSDTQQWDIITSGVHDNEPGFALVVSTLTNGCLNFDPRRAAGNQVILFSCGGRADGSGAVANSQLFSFDGGAGPFPLVPQNGNNATCLTVNGGLLDQTSCTPSTASGNELFTISASGSQQAASSSSIVTSADDAVSTSVSSDGCTAEVTVTETVTAPSGATSSSAAISSIADVATSSSSALASSAATSTVVSSIADVATSSSSTVSAPASTGTTVLNPSAVAQAQQRDDTATRAFSNAEIQTSDGQCFSVDANSGDFRENLIPVTVQACDGSAGQKWDVITAGKHNNVPGTALIVSTLTQGCLQFDSRQSLVDLFSCGGRADGSGDVSTSQLFTFTGGAGPLPLVPQNANNGICLTVSGGKVVQTTCNPATASGGELFTISASGDSSSANASSAAPVSSAAPASSTASVSASSAVAATSEASSASASTSADAASTTLSSADSVSTTSASSTVSAPASTGTTVLNPSAVAEAQQRDDTATRAFSGAQIQSSDGLCLSVDANSGDFRENLIPVTVQACNGGAGQKWDVITAGKHNNVPGTALFVSTLTQGCLNFDPRRAAGNQVILFSCGGRADGGGAVTNSQLFTFSGNSTNIPLEPTNQANTCMFNNNGNLDVQQCNTASPAADQIFTIAP
ncbi:hypothetical protein GYMLUDRAFT_44587 [Collybiopsis luxurians FD-317 M1]|uniref:Ricin B lectin domain-containing protein n=1 Tax=Collybiopsis luxurians FD-317 M1 TaxID=944289 RepID=A0A0D0CM04_9AGAR|nr:hypothetical protein GYMLUDRAFT_44587 [Collybiopsis luxurians FD-317 M1]